MARERKKERYRVNGVASVYVHANIEATAKAEAEALKLAPDIDPRSWKEDGPPDALIGLYVAYEEEIE